MSFKIRPLKGSQKQTLILYFQMNKAAVLLLVLLFFFCFFFNLSKQTNNKINSGLTRIFPRLELVRIGSILWCFSFLWMIDWLIDGLIDWYGCVVLKLVQQSLNWESIIPPAHVNLTNFLRLNNSERMTRKRDHVQVTMYVKVPLTSWQITRSRQRFGFADREAIMLCNLQVVLFPTAFKYARLDS